MFNNLIGIRDRCDWILVLLRINENPKNPQIVIFLKKKLNLYLVSNQQNLTTTPHEAENIPTNPINLKRDDLRDKFSPLGVLAWNFRDMIFLSHLEVMPSSC